MSFTGRGAQGAANGHVGPQEPPASGQQASVPPAVELRNISKDFGSNRALDGVNLRIGRGEVVGLVGQNGSGKSTMVKILAGVYAPEPGGQMFVSGEEVPLPLAPGQASEIGLSFVYQNLALAGGLTVLENLTLGQRVRGGWSPINWMAEHRKAAAVLKRYDVELDLDQRTGELAPVDQARLAIVRAAEDLRQYRTRSGYQHSVLVLDEPTVFLPAEEVDHLFDLIRAVVAEGAAVLFISHDLAAVRSITDRVVEHLAGGRLEDLSFEIGAGEILGVAGLIGSGAEELPYQLFGARDGTRGTLHLGTEELNVAGLTPQRSVRERIALVPADRAVLGLSEQLTLWENIVMLVEDQHYRGGVFRRGELASLAREAIDRFAIRPALPYAAAGTFSGGNQQKALLAKWLIAQPRLLLLHEPTQGVDVGARRDIYRFVKSAATLTQMAVLWVTTDFGELAEVCDRVIVLSQGRQLTTIVGEELTDEAISAAALRQAREVK